MHPMLIVQTTFEDREEAVQLAQEAIRRRLAACAQLTAGVTSVYWWEDTIEQSEEIVLTLKTLPQKYTTLETFIQDMHSYDTPEIIAIPVENVEGEYLRWLQEEIG